MSRRLEGRETWNRLRVWDKEQSPSEKLAAQILFSEKYESIDPSHPLGGPDGLKDILCVKDGKKYIAACYFPREQQNFSALKKKFESDLIGVETNKADGIAFVTNQELTLGEREVLLDLMADDKQLDLFHLERIAAILNAPINYGTRLEFLDIEMTKEEQLSYMVSKDQKIFDLTNFIIQLGGKNLVQGSNTETAVTVEPTRIETIRPPFSIGYRFDNPVHKCSYCKYGFKVAGKTGNSYITSNLVYQTAFNPSLNYEKVVIEYVTCPKCGNTEMY